MEKEGNIKHKYYDLAYHAYRGSSFSPEKSAIRECEEYDNICKEFIDTGNEWAIEKFSNLFVKRLVANGRCYSVMITGSANFPVARMNKLNLFEHNATKKMLEFIEKVREPSPKPRKEIRQGIAKEEYIINGIRVLQDSDDNRLKLFFDDKPDQQMIATLKSRGFKWSPRNKAWQRQLTYNAIAAMKSLLSMEKI
jgi:hypothetical protein